VGELGRLGADAPELTGHELREAALTLGPTGAWWTSAIEAVKAGALLAVVPVGYYVWVLIAERGRHGAAPGFSPAFSVGLGLLHEITFWLIAGFTLGALLAVLPSMAGVTKGMLLTAAFLAVAVLGNLIAPSEADVGVAFHTFELLLYLILLGAWLDRRAIHAGWRELGAIYRLQEIGLAVTYLAPLVASIIVIAQQILAGNAQEAIRETVSRAPGLLPPSGGG
jgi:hypothetical protein